LLSDLERISKKIVLPRDTKPDKLDRLFRAFVALAGPLVLPYYKDHFNTIWEYISWVFKNVSDVILDPIGALKRRTLELIYALADLIGVDVSYKEKE
jgi:hypothetical protein